MHANPIYRDVKNAESLAFAERRGFGTWFAFSGDNHLVATAPFYVETNQHTVKAHLTRSNPLAKLLAQKYEVKCTIVISGPDAYISPDWYGMKDQVPTWNYVVVQIRGVLRLLPDEELVGILDNLSNKFEQVLLPKPVWKTNKMPDDKMKAMMMSIVPVTLEIEHVDSTWKLGQNKPQAARSAVARRMRDTQGLHDFSRGMEISALAKLHAVDFSGKCGMLVDDKRPKSKFSSLLPAIALLVALVLGFLIGRLFPFVEIVK